MSLDFNHILSHKISQISLSNVGSASDHQQEIPKARMYLWRPSKRESSSVQKRPTMTCVKSSATAMSHSLCSFASRRTSAQSCVKFGTSLERKKRVSLRRLRSVNDNGTAGYS